MLLGGQTAIVTGSGSGMGRAMAELFAKEGATVAVADIHLASAEETVNRIRAQGGSAIAQHVDVGDASSVKNLIEKTYEQFGRIDILVNNAGLPQAFTPIEDLEEEQWDRIMRVNAKSVYLTAKYTVPIMKEQKAGVILNIASIASVRARPGLNAYCASKGAVVVLTKALAIELAPFGIRVNAINPGPANTEMLGKFINGQGEELDQKKKEIFINSVPLGRLIEPEDIAHAALYLCSPLSRSVTGTVLNVDGGRGV